MSNQSPLAKDAVTPTQVKLLDEHRKRQARQLALQVGFILLAILVVSLIVIFQEEPTPAVLTICLLIGALSIFLWLTTSPAWLFAMLMLTALVSTFAVALSFDHWEEPWPRVFPILWLFVFFGGLLMLWNAMLKVGRDEIVIIRNLTDGSIRLANATVALPPVMGLEEIIARMPYTKLSAPATVTDVPTRSNMRVPLVKAAATFRIEDPLKLHDSVSNRSQTYNELSSELKLSPRDALLEHRFWEKVAQKQASGAIMGAIRGLIWEKADNPEVAFYDRSWAEELRAKVENSLRGNGLDPLSVNLLEVETPSTTANEQVRRAKVEADARATEYTAVLEGLLRGLYGNSDEDQVRRAIGETLQTYQGKLDDARLAEIVRGALQQSSEERERRIEKLLADEERLKLLIIYAIETVRERERQRREM
jgi:hypothetical protein